MNDKLNIYDVVKYFVEKSGMLFFNSKEDVKLAYDRIFTILNCDKKYWNADNDENIEQLKNYYNFFLANYNDYYNDNQELFKDIMKIDSDIVLCSSEKALKNYTVNLKKNLEEANSALFFFQKRYAVNEGMRKFDGLVAQINKYKDNYGINLSTSLLDNVLDFLNVDSLTNEEQIVNAYNDMLSKEYDKIVNSAAFDEKLLEAVSNKYAYVREIILCYYDQNDKIEKRSLVEIYNQPLTEEPEYYEAFQYFKLNPNCTKEEMIDAVEKVIDDIMSTELISFSVSNGVSRSYGEGAFDSGERTNDDVLATVNYYKDILYKYFNIDVKLVDEDVEEENVEISNDFNNNVQHTSIFSSLFDGLDYENARKLYFSLMHNFLNSNSKENDSKIIELDDYWNSIKDDLKQSNVVYSSKPRK